jgi:hypothetical protein
LAVHLQGIATGPRFVTVSSSIRPKEERVSAAMAGLAWLRGREDVWIVVELRRRS